MAVMERDVIIAGAGPAGCICAAYLARSGADVLLLERDVMPRDKACGDMICEGAAYHIEQLGGSAKLDEMSCFLRKLILTGSRGSTASIPFECYCAPRYELDSMLAGLAAGHGAELRQSCTVTGLIREQGRVTGVKVRYRGTDTELRSRIVIGADGVMSRTSLSAGLAKDKPYGMWTGQRAYFRGVQLDRDEAKDRYDAYGVFGFPEMPGTGFFWVLPTGRSGVSEGICNVGMMMHDRDACEAFDPAAAVSRWKEMSPGLSAMFEKAERISPWKAGRLNDISYRTERVQDGFMLAGDAASLFVPLENDGLTPAADSAKAAADAASEALARGDVSADKLREAYDRSLRPKKDKAVSEMLKKKRLLMESMTDPEVSDRMIRLLNTDRIYRRRYLR